MKIIEAIKRFISGLLFVIFFTIAISLTVILLNYNDYGVSQMGNTTLIFVKDEMSSENYKKGDLVLVEAKKLDKISVGDEIFTYKVKEDRTVDIEVGIVGEVHVDDNAISFENGDSYTTDFIIGEASKIYSKIGTYLSIILSKWVFLFAILVPNFLIFIYQLYALIIEIKYERE